MRGAVRLLGSLALGWLVLAMAPAGRLRAESLQPLDVERFRAQYGQDALFRLRLGVDAALAPIPGASGADDVAVTPACLAQAQSWNASAEQRQFNQALEQRRYIDAGKALGHWQRRHGFCR